MHKNTFMANRLKEAIPQNLYDENLYDKINDEEKIFFALFRVF